MSNTRVIDPGLYKLAGDNTSRADFDSQATTADITGQWIKTHGVRRMSWTLSLTADSGAARVGAFHFEGSDDPQCERDNLSGTTDAKSSTLTLPTGSLHPDATASAGAALSSGTVAVDDTAGTFIVDLENLPAWTRVRYVSGTAGTDGAATCFKSGG